MKEILNINIIGNGFNLIKPDDDLMSINYTYFDTERQTGADQIKIIKNIKKLDDPLIEYCINNNLFYGFNSKYSF